MCPTIILMSYPKSKRALFLSKGGDMKTIYNIDYLKSDLIFYHPFFTEYNNSVFAEHDYKGWYCSLNLYQIVGVNKSDGKFKLAYITKNANDPLLFKLPALVRFKFKRRFIGI